VSGHLMPFRHARSPRSALPTVMSFLLLGVVRPVWVAGQEALPPNLDTAVSKGLAHLARQQNAEGFFGGSQSKSATTGLSILAFLSSGHTPDLGRYGLVMRNAEDWLVAHQSPDGYFDPSDRGIYPQAIATLALAETYGVEFTADRRLRVHAALLKATHVILAVQEVPKSQPAFAGGWSYEASSANVSLPLTAWNVLALRAVRDCGIPVAEPALHKAMEFVLRCYDPTAKAFGRRPGDAARPGATGAEILCLYLLDTDDTHGRRIDDAWAYLEVHPIDANSPFAYHATYYVAQAAFRRGGETWSKTGRASLERLIKLQDKDGSWPPGKARNEASRTDSTALALQTLALPYRLLPSYQR